MLVKVTIKMFAGALVAVHTLLYKDGTIVERVIDISTGVPLFIIE